MADLLTVEDLHVAFRLPEGRLHAVRGVSFSVPLGGTVALVGESGSGKSVVSQSIMGILPRTAGIESGRILFVDPDRDNEQVDIGALNPESERMRAIRGGSIGIVFQEPMTSLSPVQTVGDQVGEALALHRGITGAEGQKIVADMLRRSGGSRPIPSSSPAACASALSLPWP